MKLPSFTPDVEKTFMSVIEKASSLPLVHIDRAEFLTKNLGKMCTPEQLQQAIAEGTLKAGIPIAQLDSLANAIINAETIKVTSISAAAGIPGGLAMAATIPADVAQFYGFALVAQKTKVSSARNVARPSLPDCHNINVISVAGSQMI